MKCAPFTRPVFLSTLSVRTIAFGTIVRLPLASASGSIRLIELASPSTPSDCRPFEIVMPRGLAAARTFSRKSESGVSLMVVNFESGKCGSPSGRPVTRYIASTRS